MPKTILERPLEIADFITIAAGATDTRTYTVPSHWKWVLKKIWADRIEECDYKIVIDGNVIQETNVIEFQSEKIAHESVTFIITNNKPTPMQFDLVISGIERQK